MDRRYTEKASLAELTAAYSNTPRAVAAPLLRFTGELLQIQAGWTRLPAAAATLNDSLSSRLEAGEPLIALAEIAADGTLDLDQVRTALASVLSLISRWYKGGSNGDGFPDALTLPLEQISSGLQALFNRRTVPGWVRRVDPCLQELVVFSLGAALSPFVQALAAPAAEVLRERRYDKALCPACGQQPLMGMLHGEGGVRSVECWLCRTQWIIPRVACPFCCTTQQADLRYFYVPGREDARAYVCGNCKRYLKVTDARRLGFKPLLALEHVVTMPLDSMAAAEGYRPGCAPLFLASKF